MAPQPLVKIRINEVREYRSSGMGAFLRKRIGEHAYECTCSHWQKASDPVDRRSCFHLRHLLGGQYEDWRIQGAKDSGQVLKKTSQSTVTTAQAGSKRKTAPDDGDEDKEEEEKDKEEEEKDKDTITSNQAAANGKAKAISKRRKVNDKNDDDDEEEEKAKPAASTTTKSGRISRPSPARANLRDANFKPLLAHKWDLDSGIDVTGWHCSEKLDGVRAYWTGTRFQSREGNPFYAPYWFTKRLPKDITLDGELFTERGGFQDCVSIVRTQGDGKRWKFKVTFQVFDVPSKGHLPFEQRIAFAKDLLENKLRIKWVNVVQHTIVKNRNHVFEMLEEVTKSGGEGLMLRQPGSKYVSGRSKTLLKVKKFFDADAIVRGHAKGSGKNANVCGALECEMLDPDTRKPTGKMFKVGSGLTDQQRRTPPKIGAVIIYKYQELSNAGHPRFPTYVGERAD
ncbi:hypothetical protein BDZ91DRAFT_849727 [Kalaharituber pfeilii]|nr:hypothetical protein BDZ91DRAFT_849727 [Kalaharituber pfeilii]